MQLVYAVDGSGLAANVRVHAIQLDAVRPAEAVDAHHVLVFGRVTTHVAIVVYRDLTLRHRHPAKLAVMSVDGRLLAGSPADGHHFKQRITIDQVPGVAALAK